MLVILCEPSFLSRKKPIQPKLTFSVVIKLSYDNLLVIIGIEFADIIGGMSKR